MHGYEVAHQEIGPPGGVHYPVALRAELSSDRFLNAAMDGVVADFRIEVLATFRAAAAIGDRCARRNEDGRISLVGDVQAAGADEERNEAGRDGGASCVANQARGRVH